MKAKMITYGNIWTREILLEKAGEMKRGHRHKFDHLHFLAKGKVKVNVYAEGNRKNLLFSGEVSAPYWLKVPKDHFHDITALEDNCLGYCIQAVHDKSGNVVETDYIHDGDWMEQVNAFEAENGQPDEESL